VAEGDQRAASRLADQRQHRLAAAVLRQFPQYRSIAEFTNDSKSWYDSVQLSCRQKQWHGINTQYNYTLSKCTDYNSGSRDGATEQAMNPYDPSNNEGPCNADIRHNFNVGGSYIVPKATSAARPLQVGAVFSALSGRPFTPGRDVRPVGPEHGQMRADCLADPIYNYDLDYLFPDLNTSNSAITNRGTGVRHAPAAARHVRPQLRPLAEVRTARPEHPEGVQAAGSSRIQARGRIST
jgi:hypothetical protein